MLERNKKTKWLMANWKMNGSKSMVGEYISALQQASLPQALELVVLPPAVFLPDFHQSNLIYGAQNVAAQEHGAFTGEISAAMLHEQACRFVLVGHSERRQLFKEDNELIAKKFHIVQEHDMMPILCIGETLEQYQNGSTVDILRAQLQSITQNRADFSFKKCIIAYEPVWAIGSGLTPTAEEIAYVMGKIREITLDLEGHDVFIPTLYGGSVNENNMAMIDSIETCDGVLVGGASLKVKQLLEIVQCITCC